MPDGASENTYFYHEKHHKLLTFFYNTVNTRSYPKTCQLFKTDVNEQQKFTSMTLLHYACQLNNKEEVKELLEAGADIFSKDSNKNLPLHYLAACTDNVEIFDLLYEKAKDDPERFITEANAIGYTALFSAIQNKHFHIAHRLEMLHRKFKRDLPGYFTDLAEKNCYILGNKNPNEPNVSHIGFDDLLQAAESDDTILLQKLLNISVKYINRENNSGYDPFRIAVSHDNVENVKLLLPHSCIVSQCDNTFSIAVKHNSIKVIKYLLFNANIELTQNNFKKEDSYENGTVINLCRTKLVVQRYWKDLSTPLHDVAKTGNVAIFKIICEFYEDINIRNIDSQTPLHIATKNKNEEISCLILKRSLFSLHLYDIHDETPFYILCKNNLTEILKYLTSFCFFYFMTPEKRRSFLNMAIKTNNIWLFNYIIENERRLIQMYYGCPKLFGVVIAQNIYIENQAFLKLAIENGFTEGVFACLKAQKWDKFFRRQYPTSCNPDPRSPLQLLIEHMPEMAKILLDQCIMKMQDKHYFHYGLINDLYYSSYFDISFTDFVKHAIKNSDTAETDTGKTKTSTAVYSKAEEENVKLIPKKSTDKTAVKPTIVNTIKQNQELPFFKTVGTHPLTLMIKHERFSLLNHPFVESYIDLKWNRFAKWGYYSLCLFYLFIAFGLTILTITAKPNNVSNDAEEDVNTTISYVNDNVINLSLLLKLSSRNEFVTEKTLVNNTMAEKEIENVGFRNIISGGIVTFIFILQLGLLITRYKLYKTFDLNHRWFDIFTLVITSIASLPICLFTSFQTQWNTIVVLNFCAWITLLNYIKRHPRFGVYVVMITYVFTSFLQFAPIFIMVLLPFVVLFYVLLGEGTGIFSFFDTFIHTVVMMIGEFDYKDSVASKDSFVTSAMFCLFLFAVTIFLMNLLTGLAVSDTTKILEEAVITRKIMQIETIHHVEMIMPEWIRKKYWDGFCKEPKEISEIEKATHRFTNPGFRKLFKWWGMSKEAARKIDNGNPVEDKLVALEQKFDHSINNLNEKMNDIIELLKRR